MKKFFKWLAIGIAGIFCLLLAVGMLISGDKRETGKAGSTAPVAAKDQAQPRSVPVKQYAVDQCLDGVCIGMTAGELANQRWFERVLPDDSASVAAERDAQRSDVKYGKEKCLPKQLNAWGRRKETLCEILAGGVSNNQIRANKPSVKTEQVLEFLASTPAPVCEFYANDRVKVKGIINTPSGYTRVTFMLDSQGVLRVKQISKDFETSNGVEADSAFTKLKEKHAYATQPNPDTVLASHKGATGIAPWGGVVKILFKPGESLHVDMNAADEGFDAASNKECASLAKSITVN